MSLWSYFTNTTDQSEAQANFANEQEQYRQVVAKRLANGTLDDATAQKDLNWDNSQSLLDGSFVNSFETRNENTEPQAGAGDLAKDGLILAALLAGAWAFFMFGGYILVRAAIARKNVAVIAGIGAAICLWGYLVYKYAKLVSADVQSITKQGLSLFSFFKTS
jgi:hypothetical protein